MKELHPSHWRTCRVLANKQRLLLLRHLLLRSESTVSNMAREMALSVSSTSQHLRALNARGFLAVRREGRYVFYRVSGDDSVPDAAAILVSACDLLRISKKAAKSVFRVVTACTHPRRLEILRSLGRGDQTMVAIGKATGISRPALCRHLSKLESRGFVVERDGVYRCPQPRDVLTCTLMSLAIK